MSDLLEETPPTLFDADGRSLEEARGWLREQIDEGADCPCCDRFAKAYRRKLNAGMAASLIRMYRAHGLEFGYLPELFGYGNEFTRLRLWGLIEPMEERRDDGGRIGWWRITAKGEAFAIGRLRVPRYARVYDAQLLSLEGDPVSIRDALGSRFSYDELMHGSLT